MLDNCAYTEVWNAQQLCTYRSVECSTAVHIQKCGMLNNCAHTEVCVYALYCVQ